MATKAQIRDDRIARIWAYIVIVVMLLVSLLANILSALKYGKDPIALSLSGLPAISLFISSSLLERMRKFSWYVVVGFVLALIVSLGTSWYHIATLALDHHTAALFAWLLPLSVDIPMLLAGKSLIDHKTPTPRTNAPTAKATRQSRANAANRTPLPQPTPKSNNTIHTNGKIQTNAKILTGAK